MDNTIKQEDKNPQNKPRFITDFGQSFPITKDGEIVTEMERYGVWGDNGRGKNEVIEVSNDLEKLKREYKVPDDKVFLIPVNKA